MKRNFVFWLFALAIFSLIVFPTIIQKGTFLDASIYNAIAYNMSHGIGSYLKPIYAGTSDYFFSHPPLVFILESFYFDSFGDGFMTERLYSLTIAIALLIGIVCLWLALSNTQEEKNLAWLPVLSTFCIPLISWAFKHNILENTLSVFAIFSIVFITIGLKRNQFYLSILSAILVYLALLSKGPVGLFPFATPLIYAILYRDYEKSFLFSLGMFVFSFYIFILHTYFYSDLSFYIKQYFQTQLVTSYEVEMYENSDNRLKLISDWIWDSLILIGCILIIVWYNKSKKIASLKMDKRVLYLFFIGLSAFLPLLLSSKQRKYYLTPSLPYFALAFSFYILPFILSVIKKISNQSIQYIQMISLTILILVGFYCVINFGDYGRNRAMMMDVDTLVQELPSQTYISSKLNDYNLQANLIRNGNLYIDYLRDTSVYILVKKGEVVHDASLIPLKLETIDLYKREISTKK